MSIALRNRGPRDVQPYRNTIGKRQDQSHSFSLYVGERELAALRADADVKNLTVSQLCRAIIKGYLRASYPDTFKGPLL